MFFSGRARLLLWVAVLWSSLAAAGSTGTDARTQLSSPGRLTVTFFDVGQGDAALIVSPAGKTVLIDGGPPDASHALAARVQALVKGPLDLIVLSHPHLDHLGGLTEVVERVGAKRFLDPRFPHPSEAYRRLLSALGSAGVELRGVETDEAQPMRIGLGPEAYLEVLWPRPKQRGYLKGTRSDVNANSLVLRLRHGRTRILFTGDSEAPTEEALLAQGFDLRADVLKVAHHGSRHSSLTPFLQAVHPRAAVISCGRNNEFRHPSPPTLQRLEDLPAEVFRTDEDSEIQLVSDGTQIRLTTTGSRKQPFSFRATGERPDVPEPADAPAVNGHAASQPRGTPSFPRVELARVGRALSPYVAQRGAPEFHKATCQAAQGLLGKNRVIFASRQEAAAHLKPAKDCTP
jgi:competence protein ComEC